MQGYIIHDGLGRVKKMIFKLREEGDTKIRVSYCIIPFTYKRKMYWLQRIEKVYEYMKVVDFVNGYLYKWEFIGLTGKDV